MIAPAPGDEAPEIALSDEAGRMHRLADQRGTWVVVYFYPEDDTPGCTTEACEFRDANSELTDEGGVVWGVSPQGARSKAAFRTKFGLNFPLLADEDHAVANAYGVWVEKSSAGRTSFGVARRTFLIAPEGRVARVWQSVRPEGHAADVLAALRESRASAA